MAANPYTWRGAHHRAGLPVFPRLGSLAQSARELELRKARTLLLFVGVLSFLVHGYFLARAEAQVEQAVERQVRDFQQRGLELDMDKVRQLQRAAVLRTQMINACGMAAALLFLGLGAVVSRYPVPATVLGLAIYIAGLALLATLERGALWKGLVVNVVIILALCRAVQTALAYEDSASSASGDGSPSGDSAAPALIS